MKSLLERFKYAPFILGLLWVLVGACFEFREVAWGTGNWRGEFSLTWYVLYLSFVFLCLFLFLLANLHLYRQELLLPLLHRVTGVRNRLRIFRWLLWLCVFILPIYFFQYSAWGIVFQEVYIRFLVWAVIVLFLSIIASNGDQFAGWREFLSSLVLTASAFSIAFSLKYVNDYPFSLGWSEGNRLWDYSLLFGSHLYNYPAEKKIPALIDFGRQLVGGIPFIFPGITITMERFWVGLTLIFPYLLLGLAAFRFLSKNIKTWVVLSFWVFLFLKQGPIHPPLVLAAALVSLAWRSPLWLSIPLVAGAGYFAQASRFSWVFAPGMWIVMLEFASASFLDRKSVTTTWMRSATLGVSGLFGGFLLPKILTIAKGIVNSTTANSSPNLIDQMANSGLTSSLVVKEVTHQPLLWYRLLPNSTYGYGILFALLLAVGPIITILLIEFFRKKWKINNLQKLSLILPLIAFSAVGLVASTKIGGGGDLHNMDMFLIGLFFIVTISWYCGGREWLRDIDESPFFLKLMVVTSLIIPGVVPLTEIRPYNFWEKIPWLATLRDAEFGETFDMLPNKFVVGSALHEIQDAIDDAQPYGDILFIDQRQLLTFDYITEVELVPEYEKKVLMNEALSSNRTYFDTFYSDLVSKRFSLIVSEPLRRYVQDSSYEFSEENNIWVSWVSIPLLCYYEPVVTLKEVNVQLLAPRKIVEDCSSDLH